MMKATAARRGARRAVLSLVAATALLGTSFPALARPLSSEPAVNVLVREVTPSSPAAERAVVALGGTVTNELPIVGGFAAKVPAEVVPVLRSLLSVVSEVVVAGRVSFAGFYGEGTGAASAVYPAVVGADRAWTAGYTGGHVGVAVIDTGINATGDLAGKVVHSEDFSGEGDGVDRFGHGTFIGGLIAGSGAASLGGVKGVAPDADLISLKIAGRDGSADITHVMAALQWAVSFKNVYNIRVINLSLGTDSTQDYRIDPLDAAVERAWQAGIVVVVSAGNKGPGAGTINKPADDPFVVTVGAIRDNSTPALGDDTVPAFSGAGPTAANGLAKPDLAAPGGSVVSTRVPGSSVDSAYPSARVGAAYFKGSGTSFATAVTSASAALVLNRTPSLTPDQVKARLVDTAGAGPVMDRTRVGAGWLDTYAATMSDSTASANQGLTRSSGIGSLQLSRGSLADNIQTGTVVNALGLVVPVYSCVTGLLTAQNRLFDPITYFNGDWTTSSWYTSSWYTSSWYTSSWYTSSWYTSSWYTSSWYTSSWYTSSWYTSSWYASDWQ
jgi:serine protease AprX